MEYKNNHMHFFIRYTIEKYLDYPFSSLLEIINKRSLNQERQSFYELGHSLIVVINYKIQKIKTSFTIKFQIF